MAGSSSYNSNHSGSRTMKSTNALAALDSRWIYVYLNGDDHFQPIRCLVNQRHCRSLDSLLNQLTDRIQPPFGAVRNIYTPRAGHKVEQLDDLRQNERYVAAGGERFKFPSPGCYPEVDKLGRPNPPPKASPQKLVTYAVKKRAALPRITRRQPDIITIFVHRNGEERTSPMRCVLTPRELGSLESVLESVGNRLKLQANYVKRLCKLDGQLISDVDNLQTGQHYVAVLSYETFRKPPIRKPNRNEINDSLEIKPPSSDSTTEKQNSDIETDYHRTEDTLNGNAALGKEALTSDSGQSKADDEGDDESEDSSEDEANQYGVDNPAEIESADISNKRSPSQPSVQTDISVPATAEVVHEETQTIDEDVELMTKNSPSKTSRQNSLKSITRQNSLNSLTKQNSINGGQRRDSVVNPGSRRNSITAGSKQISINSGYSEGEFENTSFKDSASNIIRVDTGKSRKSAPISESHRIVVSGRRAFTTRPPDSYEANGGKLILHEIKLPTPAVSSSLHDSTIREGDENRDSESNNSEPSPPTTGEENLLKPEPAEIDESGREVPSPPPPEYHSRTSGNSSGRRSGYSSQGVEENSAGSGHSRSCSCTSTESLKSLKNPKSSGGDPPPLSRGSGRVTSKQAIVSPLKEERRNSTSSVHDVDRDSTRSVRDKGRTATPQTWSRRSKEHNVTSIPDADDGFFSSSPPRSPIRTYSYLVNRNNKNNGNGESSYQFRIGEGPQVESYSAAPVRQSAGRSQWKPETYPIMEGDEDVFYARTPRRKNTGSHREINLDEDNSGVFRAKRSHNAVRGASEIQESPDTKVDVPIDQLDPEEVEEEYLPPEVERQVLTDSRGGHRIVAFLPSAASNKSVYSNSSEHHRLGVNRFLPSRDEVHRMVM